MKNWLLFTLAFVVTLATLLATVAAGSREPMYKPYWEDKAARQKALELISQVGVEVKRGDLGVVVVGYRDQIDAPNRGELLQTLSTLLKHVDGYTVYLAPWAIDNATKQYLSLLYLGKLSVDKYLRGEVATEAATSPNVDKALELARFLAEKYGSYHPLGGSRVFQTPPIYVVVFRNDTSYVVYEPYTFGRDSTFADWLRWVVVIFENLKVGQGKTTP